MTPGSGSGPIAAGASAPSTSPHRLRAAAAVDELLDGHPGLTGARLGEDAFALVMRGEVRLRIPVAVEVGRHSMVLSSFLLRGPRPGESRAALHRALLRQQRSLVRTRICLDDDDDVVIQALLPLERVNAEELDMTLGEIHTVGEQSFEALVHIAYPGVFPPLRRDRPAPAAAPEGTAEG